MIHATQVMDAIQGLAIEHVKPLEKVYQDLVIDGFKRPCLLIQEIREESEDASAKALLRTMYFTLTLFDKTSDYKFSSSRGLMDLRDQVMQMFTCGYIRVEDRALHVTASTGGRDWDKAFIDLQLEFMDLRDDAPDAPPLMEHIDINMKKGRANGIT